MKLLFIILLSFILLSCQTNPPTEPLNPTLEYGKIKITSNVEAAKIFIDGVDKNKLTPDTITVTVGNHTIQLQKNGFDISTEVISVKKNITTSADINMFATNKLVLIEDFANVSCVPCVASNKIIEQLTNKTFGKKKLVAIKYPTNFPSPVDLFYLANNADCNARMSYYNIYIAPTNVIGGTSKPIPSDSNDVKEKIFAEFAKIPKFNLTVEDNIVSGNYTINISLNVLDASNLDFSKLVIHTVVTETDIEFVNPPGSNGETKFYDVMRKMLPSGNGESLANINQAGTNIFLRQINLNSSWNQNNLNTIVFIQNKDTKEIYQAGSTF